MTTKDIINDIKRAEADALREALDDVGGAYVFSDSDAPIIAGVDDYKSCDIVVLMARINKIDGGIIEVYGHPVGSDKKAFFEPLDFYAGEIYELVVQIEHDASRKAREGNPMTEIVAFEDGFQWLVITEQQAWDLFSDEIALYEIEKHLECETRIDECDQIAEVYERGNFVAIELGY